jgi:hypothetical protein
MYLQQRRALAIVSLIRKQYQRKNQDSVAWKTLKKKSLTWHDLWVQLVELPVGFELPGADAGGTCAPSVPKRARAGLLSSTQLATTPCLPRGRRSRHRNSTGTVPWLPLQPLHIYITRNWKVAV